eukprot:scaffold422_cov399-Prasinococcus_capsulatus_cf.AAC.17
MEERAPRPYRDFKWRRGRRECERAFVRFPGQAPRGGGLGRGQPGSDPALPQARRPCESSHLLPSADFPPRGPAQRVRMSLRAMCPRYAFSCHTGSQRSQARPGSS